MAGPKTGGMFPKAGSGGFASFSKFSPNNNSNSDALLTRGNTAGGMATANSETNTKGNKPLTLREILDKKNEQKQNDGDFAKDDGQGGEKTTQQDQGTRSDQAVKKVNNIFDRLDKMGKDAQEKITNDQMMQPPMMPQQQQQPLPQSSGGKPSSGGGGSPKGSSSPPKSTPKSTPKSSSTSDALKKMNDNFDKKLESTTAALKKQMEEGQRQPSQEPTRSDRDRGLESLRDTMQSIKEDKADGKEPTRDDKELAERFLKEVPLDNMKMSDVETAAEILGAKEAKAIFASRDDVAGHRLDDRLDTESRAEESIDAKNYDDDNGFSLSLDNLTGDLNRSDADSTIEDLQDVKQDTTEDISNEIENEVEQAVDETVDEAVEESVEEEIFDNVEEEIEEEEIEEEIEEFEEEEE